MSNYDIEHEKERLNWAYTAIMRGNAAALRSDTEITLMQATCDAMVSDDIYDLAWIGLPLDDNEKTVSCVAYSGHASKYLEVIKLSWADNPIGRGPAGAAIRTKVTQVNNDMWHNSNFSRNISEIVGGSVRLMLGMRPVVGHPIC